MVTIIPFYSQQNKQDSRFLLNACCTTQISRFLALALTRYMHYEVTVVVPEAEQIADQIPQWSATALWPIVIPQNNRIQRSNFPLAAITPVLRRSRLVISHHELLSAQIRAIVPRVKIIQINHLQAMGDWSWMVERQRESWRASTYVAFLGSILRARALILEPALESRALVWPLIYDLNAFPLKSSILSRDIDVLFIQRCSQSNYTHHREFLAAIRILRTRGWQGRVVFTDPTGWLEHREPELVTGLDVEFAHASDRTDYGRLLARSKCAIAMMEQDLHGGIAIREAIAAGAFPLLLRTPAYCELLGDEALLTWCAFVTLDPEQIASQIHTFGRSMNYNALPAYPLVRERVRRESYQDVFFTKVKPLVEELLRN